MKSKAAIGNHPIHPILVPVPIGAFVIAFVGDVLHTASPQDPFWYDLSFTCIGIGLIFAVLAAAVGAVDYLGVRMSSRAFRLATIHAVVNFTACVLYAASFFLRRNAAALPPARWPGVFGLSILGFALLATGGWIGGKLAYEHRVGVVEDAPTADPDRVRAAS
jgi:uncharacterized membrane protein